MIQLPPDFCDLLQELNRANVEYLLVGGYAVAYHGYVRTTNDIDIWIALHPSNAQAVKQALRSFGVPEYLLSNISFLDPNEIFYIGVHPLRVEVFTDIPGVTFAQCYTQRVETIIQGIRVPIIDLTSLKRNKQASGRPKDINDLQNLP